MNDKDIAAAAVYTLVDAIAFAIILFFARKFSIEASYAFGAIALFIKGAWLSSVQQSQLDKAFRAGVQQGQAPKGW